MELLEPKAKYPRKCRFLEFHVNLRGVKVETGDADGRPFVLYMLGGPFKDQVLIAMHLPKGHCATCPMLPF